MDGTEALKEMADRMRAAPGALERALPRCRDAVEQYLQECYARGVTPDGEPWPVTETGARARLDGRTLRVVVKGNSIQVRLALHEALHSKGQARGGTQRRMVPKTRIPPELLTRMQAIVDAELRRVLQP